MSRTIYTEKQRDPETNQLVTTRTISKTAKDKDAFVAMYIEHIGTMAKLPHYELQTLLCLTPHIDWDNGVISISSYVQDKILECSGLKYSSIRSALSRLAKRNFITKVKSNWYQINPELFWKGSELERDKQFQLIYQWDILDKDAKPKEKGIQQNKEFLMQKV
jgi:hypothetical protein